MKSKSELGNKKRQLPEEDSGFEFLYEEKGNGVPERAAAREAEAPVFYQGEGSGLKSRKGRIFSDSPGFIERKSRISLSPPFSLISSTFPLLQTSTTMKPSPSSSSCIAKRTRSQFTPNFVENLSCELRKTKRSQQKASVLPRSEEAGLKIVTCNEDGVGWFSDEDDQITKIGFGRNSSHDDEDKYESNPEFYCLSSDSGAEDEDVKKDRNFEPDSGSPKIYTVSSDSDDEDEDESEEKGEQKVNLLEKSRSEEEAEKMESDSDSPEEISSGSSDSESEEDDDYENEAEEDDDSDYEPEELVPSREKGQKVDQSVSNHHTVFDLLAGSMSEDLDSCKEEDPGSISSEEEFSKELTNEEEIEQMWKTMNLCLTLPEIGSTTEASANESANGSHNAADPCSGKHDQFLDEEIGLRCRKCDKVTLEIKYFSTPMVKDKYGSGRDTWSAEGGGSFFNELHSTSESLDFRNSCDPMEREVWNLIPEEIRSKLHPHQQDGLRFLWKNLVGTFDLKLKNLDSNDSGGCIICHAPGTGKTGLTLVFLQTFLKLFPRSKPVIVAPACVLLNWEEEFKKWKMMDIPFHILNVELSEVEKEFADKRVGQRSLSKNEARMVKLALWKKKPSVLVVSYSLFEKIVNENPNVIDPEGEKIRRILLEDPGLLVLDEGHTPRNHSSGIWQVLSKVHTQKRISLSGTLFQNNFHELYNTLCSARPSFSKEIPPHLKKFCQRKSMPIQREEVEELKLLMAPFVNVHQDDVLKQKLRGLRECRVFLNLPELQKQILQFIEPQNSFGLGHKLSIGFVHPSLLIEHDHLSRNERSAIAEFLSEKHNNVEFLKKELRQNPNEGAKTRFLIEFIRLADSLGERVLIFSQCIAPLKFAMEQLQTRFNWSEGKQVLYIAEKMSIRKRHSLIKMFNEQESEAKVMLASIRACSEGIHLVGASRVIFFDIDWNPSVEKQAISRAFRLGQKRVVYTYHLRICDDVFEAKKGCVQEDKENWSEFLVSCGEEMERSFDGGFEDVILEEMMEHEKLRGLFGKVMHNQKNMSPGI